LWRRVRNSGDLLDQRTEGKGREGFLSINILRFQFTVNILDIQAANIKIV